MTTVEVFNVSLNTLVTSKAVVADSFLSRLRGLLGRSEFSQGEGLLIKPCNCVHSFGMRFPIDVVFLTAQGEILRVLRGFQTNKISPPVKGAKMVLELPAGTAEQVGLKEQQILKFNIP